MKKQSQEPSVERMKEELRFAYRNFDNLIGVIGMTLQALGQQIVDEFRADDPSFWAADAQDERDSAIDWMISEKTDLSEKEILTRTAAIDHYFRCEEDRRRNPDDVAHWEDDQEMGAESLLEMGYEILVRRFRIEKEFGPLSSKCTVQQAGQ